MTAQEYILSGLEKLQMASQIVKHSETTSESIFSALMSKKFRKYSVNQEYQTHIRSAIELSMKNGEPIKITFVFGGYKLWRFDEAPEVDWAELFSLMYYANWLMPIAQSYAPGVWLDFYSDDVIVDRMNGVPRSDVDAYISSFRKLLNFLGVHLPSNIKFTLSRVAEQYEDMKAFDAELSEKIKETSVVSLTNEQMATLRLNVHRVGTAEPDWVEIQRLHDAYAQVTKRRPYYRTPDKIMAITKQLPNTIAIGTTKTSIAKFWAGVGAFKKREDAYIEYVLSPSQLEAAAYEWEQISVPGLAGKNFSRVRILS